jgi:hypothetical protein
VITPVLLLYEMIDAPESDDDEILLLNVVQSVDERHPNVDPFDVAHVRAPAVLMRPFPVRSVKYSPLIPRFVVKRFVVVALDPVALRNVKFWSVDEPVARIFAAESVPDNVSFPPFAVVYERFVVKKFVVVADVPVALRKVRFWSVVEPFARSCWNDDTAVVEVAMIAPTVGVVVTPRDPAPVQYARPFTTPVPLNPLPLLIHVPLIAKHPAPRLIPFANVDEAVVEETLITPAATVPVNVDVPVEDA